MGTKIQGSLIDTALPETMAEYLYREPRVAIGEFVCVSEVRHGAGPRKVDVSLLVFRRHKEVLGHVPRFVLVTYWGDYIATGGIDAAPRPEFGRRYLVRFWPEEELQGEHLYANGSGKPIQERDSRLSWIWLDQDFEVEFLESRTLAAAAEEIRRAADR